MCRAVASRWLVPAGAITDHEIPPSLRVLSDAWVRLSWLAVVDGNMWLRCVNRLHSRDQGYKYNGMRFDSVVSRKLSESTLPLAS